ncbi:MAG: hypothetical protein RLZ95_1202 [Bacteroidota bacterium]
MKKYFIYILLFSFAFILMFAPASAQKKSKKSKQSTSKKKNTKSKTKKGKTVKVVKSSNANPEVKLDVNYTVPASINKDTLPEKVVTILSAFKPQLKNIAKIDFVNASERKDTGSIRVEYQVPSQNLSFQYKPIPLVPRSFKMDSLVLLQRNSTLKFGYGNYFHHFIDVDHYFLDGYNNTHSFNINNESIQGEHPLQSTRNLSLSYIGDYAFTNKGHLLSKMYYQQIGRYRYGLVPDSTLLPLANFKQNSFLTGAIFNWISSKVKSNNVFRYAPSLLYERFEGIEAASNHFLNLNIPMSVGLNNNTSLHFDVAYSMSQFSSRILNGNTKYLLRIDPNLVFNKFGSEFKVGVSPVLVDNQLHLYPDIAYKKTLKDTNYVLIAGWHAYANNNSYSSLVSQNPWISVPNQLEITTQDSKFLALNISNGKRLNYGFGLSINDYTNFLLFNKKKNTNILNNGLYYQSIFEKKASTIQLDANLRYQFSDHFLITNDFKYIQFNSLQENAKPWGILPLELNSKLSWSPNSIFQLNGALQYFTGATLFNESSLPYDLDNVLVINASMTYKLTNHFTAWLKGDNLLNKPYQRWSNYPSLGVQLIAGVVYSFK